VVPSQTVTDILLDPGAAPACELPMTAFGFACLIAVFLLTALVSVVTGGSSLITVPVMMQLGIEPHVAVATNMLTLTLLSLGGTMPFLKTENRHKASLKILLFYIYKYINFRQAAKDFWAAPADEKAAR
jgi:hypothetical protein